MQKSIFSNPLRTKLRRGGATFGLWVTIEAAAVTEVAAMSGVDWICVDMEHGALGYREVADHLRAANGSDLAVIVRVPTTTVDHVKRALDLGAHALLLPLIRSAEDLEDGFSHARYPPRGRRGLGIGRATGWGTRIADYVAVADEETMVIPVIETAEASASIEAILKVEGLEAVFFGPGDLSQSFGHRAVWEGPGIADDILRMRALAAEAGIASGIIGTDREDMQRRREQGFQLIGLGSDVGLIANGLAQALGALDAPA